MYTKNKFTKLCIPYTNLFENVVRKKDIVKFFKTLHKNKFTKLCIQNFVNLFL